MRDFYGFSPDSALEKPGIFGISAGLTGLKTAAHTPGPEVQARMPLLSANQRVLKALVMQPASLLYLLGQQRPRHQF